MGRLVALLAEVPDDAQSLANLAALHAGRGEHDRALPLMASAVRALRARGQVPPPSWTAYLAARN